MGYTSGVGGNATVSGDVNGDGTADIAFVLAGVNQLLAGHFLL
jgi:hypothetical protein